MTHANPPVQHVITELLVTSAKCSCGTELHISSTVADNLSTARCQDTLLDMFREHRDDTRKL